MSTVIVGPSSSKKVLVPGAKGASLIGDFNN
jgi:hypothetical protein